MKCLKKTRKTVKIKKKTKQIEKPLLKKREQPFSSWLSFQEASIGISSITYLLLVLVYWFTHLEETQYRFNRLPSWVGSLLLLVNISWGAYWIMVGKKWIREGKLDFYRENLQGIAITTPYLLELQYALGLSDRLVMLVQSWLPNLSSLIVVILSKTIEWALAGAIGNGFWQFLKSNWERKSRNTKLRYR